MARIKYAWAIVLSLFMLLSCGEKPLQEGYYRINGTVSGLENGEIYLLNGFTSQDTISVINGKFTIEKELTVPVNTINFLKDANNRSSTNKTFLQVYVEPTIMTLNLDYEDFGNSKLTGSTSQDEKYQLDKIKEEIALKYVKEQKAFDDNRKQIDIAYKEKASEEELKKLKYKDDDLKGKLYPMYKEQEEATLQFIKDNPKAYVSAQSLPFLIRDMQYDEAKAFLDQLNPAHLKTGMAATLEENIEDMKKGVPGAMAGNFDTVDVNGNPIKLADFKGKYLLIDFWASWCVPCRKGNPHLIELYKKYNPKGLEILGVADDDFSTKAWKKAIKTDQIGIWHHVLSGKEFDPQTRKLINKHKDIGNGYNINSLPTKILVGPDGIILGRYGGGGGTDEDMDADLAKIFEE